LRCCRDGTDARAPVLRSRLVSQHPDLRPSSAGTVGQAHHTRGCPTRSQRDETQPHLVGRSRRPDPRGVGGTLPSILRTQNPTSHLRWGLIFYALDMFVVVLRGLRNFFPSPSRTSRSGGSAALSQGTSS